MHFRARQLALIVIGATMMTCALSGCGTINEKISDGISDNVPHWLGGLPDDAPPRPGSAKYEAYMREREKNRLIPAAQRDAPSSADAVH